MFPWHKGRILGSILAVTLVCAVIVALVLAYFLANETRARQTRSHDIAKVKMSYLKNKIANILNAPKLCTCNLRGLVLENANGVLSVALNKSSKSPHRKFGFYKLSANDQCATGINDIDPSDVVLDLDSENGAVQVSLFNFVEQPSTGADKKFLAKFGFVTHLGENPLTTRSNISDLAEVEVYLETESLNGNLQVKGCYAPTGLAGSGPQPPTSPPGSLEAKSCYKRSLTVMLPGKGCTFTSVFFSTLSDCSNATALFPTCSGGYVSDSCEVDDSTENRFCDTPGLPIYVVCYENRFFERRSPSSDFAVAPCDAAIRSKFVKTSEECESRPAFFYHFEGGLRIGDGMCLINGYTSATCDPIYNTEVLRSRSCPP